MGGGRCFLFFIIIIFFKTVFEIYVRFRKFQLFFLTPCPITPKPVAISRASIAACDPPFPGREGVGGGWKMTWKRETQNLAIFVFFCKVIFSPIFALIALKRCPIDSAAHKQSRAPLGPKAFFPPKNFKNVLKKRRFLKKLIENFYKCKIFLEHFFFQQNSFLTRFSTFGGFFEKNHKISIFSLIDPLTLMTTARRCRRHLRRAECACGP